MIDHDMPKYRSHKEVWAGEIGLISIGKETIVSFKDCKPIHFINEEYEKITARYSPVVGDFMVIYPDNYISISPRKAFLDGYVKI